MDLHNRNETEQQKQQKKQAQKMCEQWEVSIMFGTTMIQRTLLRWSDTFNAIVHAINYISTFVLCAIVHIAGDNFCACDFISSQFVSFFFFCRFVSVSG